jgi:hypothetical protein
MNLKGLLNESSELKKIFSAIKLKTQKGLMRKEIKATFSIFHLTFYIIWRS